MKKNDKIIIIFYVFLAISFTVGILYIDSTFDTTTLPNILPKPVTELEINKQVDIEKEKIFLIMTDLENYTKILPRNIKSIEIIEEIDNVILAEYEVVEAGITSKLLVQHIMYPYHEHIMEVMDGDAKGTKITQTFTDADYITTIHTLVEFDLKGILSSFGFLPKQNLEHAANTIVTSFIDYSQISQNETKKIIDDLYREILQRPADQEAFEYWGSLLEAEKISKPDLRKSILKSQEAIDLKRFDSTRGFVKDVFNEILNRNPTINEADHYKYLVDIEEITEHEIRLELEKIKESMA